MIKKCLNDSEVLSFVKDNDNIARGRRVKQSRATELGRDISSNF